MNEDRKIILVRSSRKLIKDGFVGYGSWKRVDFSKYENEKDLLENGFKNNDTKRRKNQIKKFFNLKKGDIVVVPVAKAIVIGIVSGEKEYNDSIKKSYNRIKVDFKKNSEGIVYIPRDTLTTKLQTRLKIRTSIADLDIFKEEIEELYKSDKILTWDEKTIKKEEELVNDFKDKLLKRLQNSKEIGLLAGGVGFEKLIVELLEVLGYDSRILSKKNGEGIEDIDIEANKEHEITSEEEILLIQAKHHKNYTGRKGIDQLIAREIDNENSNTKKILMTTAKVSKEDKEYAEDNQVIVIDGKLFIELLYENINNLSSETRRKLGISSVYTLI